MKISDILSEDSLRVPLEAKDKTAAITELVDVLHRGQRIGDRDEVLRAVLDRERVRSTGIGHGLAVPHGKARTCSQLVMAVGKADTPIDFASADRLPCELIILLVSPIDQTGPHIQALAHISRMWLKPSLRMAVSEATTPAQLYEAIRLHEQD
ncbi:MAG: PTS sugar transporter subunit IIA [Phycisphaerae bacterium]|nr:PTS sugar transporter subunit IIA [Phycisphaerae bacterium]